MSAPKGHPKWGGKKTGTKNKRTIEQEKAQQITREEILKELVPILQALINKSKKGNIPAIQEALNRAIGKVKDTIELEGEVQLNQEIKLGEKNRKLLEEFIKLRKTKI